MHRFLEDTADQYMTRVVTTVTRQTTMRELEALFDKGDFNSFPVVEEASLRNPNKASADLRHGQLTRINVKHRIPVMFQVGVPVRAPGPRSLP